MMDRFLSDGPIMGRFFLLSESVPKGAELLSKALPYKWEERPEEESSGFCTGSSPFGGDIDECREDLSYNDRGSGVWRMWIREEERKVSKKAAEMEASVMASARHGMHLNELPYLERKEILGRAHKELLKRSVPHVRVVPVIVHDNWIWVGKRKPGVQVRFLLKSLVGEDAIPDPVVWSGDFGRGWNSFSSALLRSYLKRSDSWLSEDVQIAEIDLRGTRVRFKAGEEDDGSFRATIQSLLNTSPELEVSSVGFYVRHGGDRVQVDVDISGLISGVPGRSAGGLLAERIRRRFTDLRMASKSVGRMLEAIFQDCVKGS
jgi:hypothetical protein